MPNDLRISAVISALGSALSARRAEFRSEIPRIKRRANVRGGGVSRFDSGTFVAEYVEAIRTELRERSRVVRRALDEALSSQNLNLRQDSVGQLQTRFRDVWDEQMRDLRDLYRQRVSVHERIAEEQPFEPLAEAVLQNVLVDIENRALAPGFWSRNKDQILRAVILGFITLAFGLLSAWLLSLLFPGKS